MYNIAQMSRKPRRGRQRGSKHKTEPKGREIEETVGRKECCGELIKEEKITGAGNITITQEDEVNESVVDEAVTRRNPPNKQYTKKRKAKLTVLNNQVYLTQSHINEHNINNNTG